MQKTNLLQTFNVKVFDDWTLKVLRLSEWREYDPDKNRDQQNLLGVSVTVMIDDDRHEQNGYEKGANYGEQFTIKVPSANFADYANRLHKGDVVKIVGIIKANLYSSRNNGFMDALSVHAKAVMTQKEYTQKLQQQHKG